MNAKDGETYIALLCLAFCAFYGVSASSIDVFGGEEAMTSRTFPYLLTAVGAACSLTILISALRERSASRSGTTHAVHHWRACAGLVGLALVYTFLLTRVGFVVSTAGFLFAGIVFLGERRWRFVVPAAILPPVIFWLLLELGLDIRLP